MLIYVVPPCKITNCHTCDEVDISGPIMSVLLKIISIYINLTYLEQYRHNGATQINIETCPMLIYVVPPCKITNCHTCDEVDISGPIMSVLLKIISIYINLTYWIGSRRNSSQNKVLHTKLQIVTCRITNCHTCDEVGIFGPIMSVLL